MLFTSYLKSIDNDATHGKMFTIIKNSAVFIFSICK